MSDIIPAFDGNNLPSPGAEVTIEVFKPDLQGVDWGLYEERQATIDDARVADRVVDVVRQYSSSPQGLILNNMHSLTLRGNLPHGLEAPLAVFTRSEIPDGLVRANLHGAVGSSFKVGTTFRYADVSDGVFPNLDLRGVDARGARFGNAVLTGLLVDKDTQLDCANFKNAYLIDATGFTDEHLNSADFQGAFVLANVGDQDRVLYDLLSKGFESSQDLRKSLREARFIPSGYRMPRISKGFDLRAIYAENLTGDGVQFTERNMTGSKLNSPDIRRSTMAGSYLSGIVVSGGTFDDTDMHDVWAPGMTLQDVSMRGVDFTNANLVGAFLRGVDLRGSVGLEKANTDGLVIEDCVLPQGFYYENATLINDHQKTKPELGE